MKELLASSTVRLAKRCVFLTLLCSLTATLDAQWIEAKSANYSIFYQAGYERDAEFTRAWLNRAEELLKSKYGVAFSGFYISFYLYPAPTELAGGGLANLHCCSNGADGIKNGTVSYLAPGARAWSQSPGFYQSGTAQG